jgi:Protein of unknown function (DUF550)
MDLAQHLIRQMAFSRATFGPGQRKNGVLDHIEKELIEVRDGKGDPKEWVDLVILALDGLTRELINRMPTAPKHVIAYHACKMIVVKQDKNERRDWPDWRGASADKAIEHVRPQAAANGTREQAVTPEREMK